MVSRFLKIITAIFIIGLSACSISFAQNNTTTVSTIRTDTIYSNTQPVGGLKPFAYHLDRTLSQADTVGRRHRVRIDNIGFIVSKTGKVDSTWIIFHPRPIHNEIMKFLKTTHWVPARVDGQPVISAQEMDIDIYLTKVALKRHQSWRSLAERILSPWSN